MAFLPELAFAFARFVVGEHHRCGFPRRTFALAAARRWNAGSRHQHRPDWNGGLRRRHRGNRWVPRRRYSPAGGLRRRLHGNRWVPRRRYSPGGGLRRRLHGNRLCGNHWAPQHHNRHRSLGAPGPSTRSARREQTPVAAAEPAVVAAPEVAAEEVVDAVYEDEASASNVSADADELVPLPPEFAVPPMEWLLGGPSAGWLIDDPERDFGDEPVHDSGNEELAAHPPPVYYCMCHVFEPCLPSPTPSPEAPVLLHRFASAMAARPAEIRTGTWSPALLGLTNCLEELRLDDPSEGTSLR